jgi:predicted nicotinamide N-methyase
MNRVIFRLSPSSLLLASFIFVASIHLVESFSAGSEVNFHGGNNYLMKQLYDDLGGPYATSKQSLDDHQEEEEDEVDQWYPTERMAFEFTKDAEHPNALWTTRLVIRETSFGCGKLGHCVWPAAVALSLILVAHPELVQNKRVLELGAGCGLPSRLCQDLGAAAVLATDFWQPDESDDLRRGGSQEAKNLKEGIPEKFHAMNLQYNTQTAVQRIDWRQLQTVREAKAIFQPDILLGSDLVYYPVNLQPLLDTLQVLLDQDKNCASAAIFVSPLPPDHEREALPDFRRKIHRTLPNHQIDMQEVTLFQPQDGKTDRFLKTFITKK